MAIDQSKREELFRAVYEKYNSLVRSVIYNICGAEELDDLVQEAFIKIWKGLPTFNGRSSLKTWLYRVATNTALDAHRKGIRPNLTSTDQMTTRTAYEDGELVTKGMQMLSPDHRTVVLLCIIEGQTVSDAANILDVAEGTVKSRLYYAKDALRKFFTDNGVTI